MNYWSWVILCFLTLALMGVVDILTRILEAI